MQYTIRAVIPFVLLLSFGATAFDSGSTGADGALTPSVDTELQLPDDGIFNFTEVVIPAGVTVTFSRNATNTPVTMLVSGDATVDGTIDVSGEDAAPSNGAGDGNVGDDGLPGLGGPGGFRGGSGGPADPDGAQDGPRRAQGGIGPGGTPPNLARNGDLPCPGSGGSFGSSGDDGRCFNDPPAPAPAYGSPTLLPLIGGSGGSGGAGGEVARGSGGGGGGGAILIAVSGTLSMTGSILADGGAGGDKGIADESIGGPGGGGSGGGIRLLATTLTGNGTIDALGGAGGTDPVHQAFNAGGGGAGRIRLEAETLTRTAPTNPPFTSSTPGEIFLTGMPALRIASVAGEPAPAVPTGEADIVLPQDTPNPVEVGLEASNVPLGNTITVTLTPPSGDPVSVVSGALDGTEANSTATASLDLPDGPSVMLATLSFTIAEGQQMAWMPFTGGERVARVELRAGISGESSTVLVTTSGRRIPVRGRLPAYGG